MSGVHNFSAGPAMMPAAVLERAREELRDWQGSGMSVMEVSHRGKAFVAAAEKAEADLRTLLGVPDNYRVLFLQGGATLQFSMVPMNLAAPGQRVEYVNTGAWSQKAIDEAGRHWDVAVVADAGAPYRDIPPPSVWRSSGSAAYLHYTPNETIGGVEFHYIPDTGDVPLVADMSSTLLSRPLAVDRFGLIYAGAQKNIGPAGLTLVIVRDDLLGRGADTLPAMLSYARQAEAGSMLNTPPTFAWYLAGLVFEWLLAEGGLAAMAGRNYRKAARLYNAIDSSSFYTNPVDEDCRSWMNVPFTLARPELDALFLEQAEAEGLLNLKGHRSVGGMRASLYNAMPMAGVEALVAFMQEFERRHG
ncbi:MAG: 3-phosphoserine/phosphohydroxythreonine transaminase [Gammaproteobacteria bacterium]|nr:3-phosphoserine/phosphohydroxythreonine transaminase [Gammaproteobacteria bacterium]